MSNNIYTKKFHYVYQITEISTNKKYIGVRSSEVEPQLDIGIKYFSSSSDREFIKNQKENPINYKYEVISLHESREDASLEEIRLHEEFNVSISDKFYNRTNATSTTFSPYGKVAVKDKNNNCLLVDMNDQRYLSGELVGVLKGLTCVRSKNGEIILIDKNDKRIETGEFIHINKGYVTILDEHNNSTKRIHKNEYSKDDHIHINKGKILCKDNSGNFVSVLNDDSRLLNGDLTPIAKGMVCMKEANGNVVFVNKNDQRIKTGELVHINKDKITVKDKYGNTSSTSKDDPRYLSGELIGITGMWYSIEGIIMSKKEAILKYNISEKEFNKRISSDSFIEWHKK